MSAIKIRRATPDDAAAFARMMEDEEVFGQLMQVPYPSVSGWRKLLETTHEPGRPDISLVAGLDDELVGNAGLHSVGSALRRRHAMSEPEAARTAEAGRIEWIISSPTGAMKPLDVAVYRSASARPADESPGLALPEAWRSVQSRPIASAPVGRPALSFTSPKLRSTYNLLPFL